MINAKYMPTKTITQLTPPSTSKPKRGRRKKRREEEGDESKYVWEGNSKIMFEKLVASTPRIFRARLKASLLKAIVAKLEERNAVTEDIVFKSVKETTPKAFLKQSLKMIEPLKS